ncbi:hypothetical protein [Chroococcidiopsis sp.]|uniref:hypothetical protein n=1 Tax=Chroococcidiopsis sp. TaxID=3088168 RepID=UPI003F36F0BF
MREKFIKRDKGDKEARESGVGGQGGATQNSRIHAFTHSKFPNTLHPTPYTPFFTDN